jgi:hypothetical protein
VRRPAAVLGALLTAAAVVLPAVPAAAGGTLAPGGSQTLTVALPDWGPRADRLGVSVGSLVQYENDCVEPETESGDDTCGATQGELADFLEARVAAGVTRGGTCDAGDGVPLDLAGARVSAFDVADVDCLVLRLHFPDGTSTEPDNRAQSDSLTFSLDVVGEQDLADQPADGGEGQNRGTDSGNGTSTPGGGTAVDPANSGNDTGPGAPIGPGADGDGGGGAAVAGGAGLAGTGAAAGGSGTSAVATVPGTAVSSPEKSVVGQAATPVSVDDDGLAVATEAASSSLVTQVLSWGSLFLGAVLLGGLVFVLVRRRRRERAA